MLPLRFVLWYLGNGRTFQVVFHLLAVKTDDFPNPPDAQPVPIHRFDVHKYLSGNHWQHLFVRVCYHIFHF
jgi:hypothetical protein